MSKFTCPYYRNNKNTVEIFGGRQYVFEKIYFRKAEIYKSLIIQRKVPREAAGVLNDQYLMAAKF